MNKFSKIIAGTIVAVFLSSSAFAVVTPSWYLGAQVGYGDQNYSKGNLRSSTVVVTGGDDDTSGFAYRFLVGYQHNDYFAVELGYARFTEAEIDKLVGAGPGGA